MKIFISGGCKNGKSTCAQTLAKRQQAAGQPLYYVATMLPADEEDDARIARHVAERDGLGFVTVEAPRSIAALRQQCCAQGSLLLDSLTALLSNEMFCGEEIDAAAPLRVAHELQTVLEAFPNIVIVSDYIYADAMRYSAEVEQYRAGLALLDKICARLCDTVLEVCSGIPVVHKGEVYVHEIM